MRFLVRLIKADLLRVPAVTHCSSLATARSSETLLLPHICNGSSAFARVSENDSEHFAYCLMVQKQPTSRIPIIWPVPGPRLGGLKYTQQHLGL